MINETFRSILKDDGYSNFKRTMNYHYALDFNHLADPEFSNKTVRGLWDCLYQNIPSDLLDKLYEPEEGNPISIEYKGRKVTADLGISASEYFSISQAIDFISVSNILEIGAGYGRTAYAIKTLHPSISYTIYDLPQSLEVSSRYLKSVLAQDNMNFTDRLPDDSFDLVLAIDCLHEMTKEEVKQYFNHISSHAKYFYFSCFKDTYNPFDDIRWTINDYPINSKWREVFLNEHRVRQNYFEALYAI